VTAPVARPDLVETALTTPPALARPGTGFSLSHTVRNQGAATAAASTTRFRLSRDTQKTADDLLLTGTHAVPSLAPGATSSRTLTVTIAAGTPFGTYFVLACADDAQTVTEDSETNNCRASAGTVIVALPDLVQQAVSSPGGPFRPGARFTVSDTAFNDSPMPTGKSVTTKYYFSLNATKDAGDKLLTGSRTVANLAAFTGSSGSVTVTIPSSTVPRTYTLLACTDATGGLTEASETNNCGASATPVVVAP
jgi:subtilase family serine protease